MADSVTVAALLVSLMSLSTVIYLLFWLSRKQSIAAKSVGLESSVSEINGAISNMNVSMNHMITEIGQVKQAASSVNQVLTTMGELKTTTDSFSSEIHEVRRFTELFQGSSQKRGAFGELMIRQYLEMLPKELWEEQFTIPGSSGRVDYALRINNNGREVFLPIDSKFSLPKEIEGFADIANKLASKRAEEVLQYIVAGTTTDFAVMVLPSAVYYSLNQDAVREMTSKGVIPAPIEGVMVLCGFVLRAHQSLVVEQSTKRVKDYAQRIQTCLTSIQESAESLEKSLKTAQKSAHQTSVNVNEAIDELDEITNHLKLDTEMTGEKQESLTQST